MPKLLKILTGPQEGAEIELTPEVPLRIGSGADCDVMLVDTMAPPNALEIVLEGTGVSATAQTANVFVVDQKLAEGEKSSLPDYAVITIGSTRCAVGDSDESWPAMRWIPLDVLLAEKPEATPGPEAPQAEGNTEDKEQSSPDSSASQAEDVPLSREQLEKLDQLQSKKRASRSRAMALLLWFLLFVICVAGMLAAGRYTWNIAKPQEEEQASILDATRQARSDFLQDKISKYQLTVEKDENDQPIRLTGNLPTAADRTHLEQFIKYDYPSVIAELTDDETLTKSLAELLHGLTDDRITIDSLHNCKASVSGMTISEAEWNLIYSNIIKDIPRLHEVKSNIVFADVMAAKLREALRKTDFNDVRVDVFPGELQFTGFVTEARHRDFQDLLVEAAKYFPKNAKLTNLVKWIAEKPPVVANAPALAPTVKESKPKRLPITGIVVSPYPFVILEDGQRLGVGSQIGDYVIDAIDLDEVTLSHNDEKITWRP